MGCYSVGIDIGGTFIKYALVDENYNIIKRWKKESIKFDLKNQFYDYLCSDINQLDEVEFIGVSAPGVIDFHSNVRSYAAPNVQIMYGTNINDEIKERTNKKVFSINDAKSAGLCEFKIGNAKGAKTAAFLIIGSGTGGCICNENGVVYGKDFYAGEFHHMAFLNFKTGKIDRLGDHSSITALINIYNDIIDNEKVKYGAEVIEKYLSKDKKAEKAVKQWIDNIVIQLISINSLYNPEIICIGGGISEEIWFIDLLKREFKKKIIDFVGADIITTRIESCYYNNDANILGAIINSEEMLRKYKL